MSSRLKAQRHHLEISSTIAPKMPYTVKLDDGVAFKVKPTSVRAEGSGGQVASVSGGGGVVPTKAKGKTKGKAKGKSKGKAKQERAEFDML